MRGARDAAKRPPTTAPIPRPAMNTDTTMLSTGVITPKLANARRNHTTWYTRPAKPEQAKAAAEARATREGSIAVHATAPPPPVRVGAMLRWRRGRPRSLAEVVPQGRREGAAARVVVAAAAAIVVVVV